MAETAPDNKPATQPDNMPGMEPGNGIDAAWMLRLYVAGENQRSRAALTNLRRLCEFHLGSGHYDIEVIDLVKNPQLAKADQILAVPTLIRKMPEPIKRVIGDLSDSERTIVALDLARLTDGMEES